MGEKPVVVVKVWAKSSQLSTIMYQVLSNNSIRSPPPTTDRMMIRVRDEVQCTLYQKILRLVLP